MNAATWTLYITTVSIHNGRQRGGDKGIQDLQETDSTVVFSMTAVQGLIWRRCAGAHFASEKNLEAD